MTKTLESFDKLLEFFDKFFGKYNRGKRKSKVAIHVANKLLSIGWSLQRSKKLYAGFGDYTNLKKKLKREKLEGIDTSSFIELA